jgi:hypothetical protein
MAEDLDGRTLTGLTETVASALLRDVGPNELFHSLQGCSISRLLAASTWLCASPPARAALRGLRGSRCCAEEGRPPDCAAFQCR